MSKDEDRRAGRQRLSGEQLVQLESRLGEALAIDSIYDIHDAVRLMAVLQPHFACDLVPAHVDRTNLHVADLDLRANTCSELGVVVHAWKNRSAMGKVDGQGGREAAS